jgi:hypothetical protein
MLTVAGASSAACALLLLLREVRRSRRGTHSAEDASAARQLAGARSRVGGLIRVVEDPILCGGLGTTRQSCSPKYSSCVAGSSFPSA